jgi:hypothetical protein
MLFDPNPTDSEQSRSTSQSHAGDLTRDTETGDPARLPAQVAVHLYSLSPRSPPQQSAGANPLYCISLGV